MSTAARSIGAILAGGRSSRFGSDKRIAELDGVMLVERVRLAVQDAVDEMVLVTGDGQGVPGVPLPPIADNYPGAGPLGGIHAALTYARGRGASGALVVGCDMPFLTSALLRYLVVEGLARGHLAVVPESGGRRGVEPLCAWYPCHAIGMIEADLQASRLSAHTLLERLPASRVPLETIRRFGEPSHLFRNVNTPADLIGA